MLVTDQEKLRARIQALAEEHGRERSGLLPILQEIQRSEGHVSDFAMQVIADEIGIHPVEVYSVVTFYAFLTHDKSQGKFVIRVCRTITCAMEGADKVARQLENDLGIEFGETTPDGKFTLEWANCLGMCDQGPALLVNDVVFTKVTPDRVHDIIEGCRKTFGVYAMEAKEGSVG